MSDSRREFTGTIAVLEEMPNWAPELARQFPEARVVADRTDTLANKAVRGPTIDLLVVDAKSLSCPTHPTALTNLTQQAAAVLVLLDPGDDGSEWMLRDLGAHSVVTADWTRPQVVSACRRLLFTLGRTAPL